MEGLNEDLADQELKHRKYKASFDDMVRKMAITNPLRELGGYVSPSEEHFNGYPNQRPYYKTPVLGLIKDPSYCDIIDMKHLYNSESVYNNMTFLADYIPKSKTQTYSNYFGILLK